MFYSDISPRLEPGFGVVFQAFFGCPVAGNTLCFFDTLFSDATRLPWQISQGFQNVQKMTISPWNKEKTNH